jgi:hypothetical protein
MILKEKQKKYVFIDKKGIIALDFLKTNKKDDHYEEIIVYYCRMLVLSFLIF